MALFLAKVLRSLGTLTKDNVLTVVKFILEIEDTIVTIVVQSHVDKNGQDLNLVPQAKKYLTEKFGYHHDSRSLSPNPRSPPWASQHIKKQFFEFAVRYTLYIGFGLRRSLGVCVEIYCIWTVF